MTDPGWGPIGREVFDRTYARKKADGTKESFDDVVHRMVDGNLALAGAEHQLDDERERLVSYIKQLKLVPAGRHWWVSGVPGRQFLFNCHRAGWTDQLADHVGFTFDELMKGGGVGCNYSSEYLARTLPVARRVDVLAFIQPSHPDAQEVYEATPRRELIGYGDVITVPDTREGWVHALEHVCRTAQLEGPDTQVCFDVSKVRPRGSDIVGFGGTACGPGPLVEMLVATSRVLNQAVGRRLTPIEAMTLDHEVARCVIAGNVRRSSRMSIMHWADPDIVDFIKLKWDGGHWTTNISVEVDDEFWKQCRLEPNGHARRLLEMVADGMLHSSEPGLFNSSLAGKGEERDVRCTNPCGEIALEEWEQCNLGHLNLARLGEDEIDEALCLMTRWLIRATFGDGCSFKQRQVVDRNRRIGVGIMGFQEWLYARFNTRYSRWRNAQPGLEDELERMQRVVRLEADAFALQLGIPAPIKTTTVAPTGTVAKMAGATEGMHPCFSRYFYRRVRYASDDPALYELAARGLAMEPDLHSPKTTVVTFPCRDAALDLVPTEYLDQSDEVELSTMLGLQALVQKAWADNAVSFTINLPADHGVSSGLLTQRLMGYGPELKGTTVNVEGRYEQAPLERMTPDDFESLTTSSSADDCVGACPVR